MKIPEKVPEKGFYYHFYEASVYKAGKLFDIRPLDMWIGEVVIDGNKIPRFKRITERNIISKLKEIKLKMYGGSGE